MLIKLFTKIVLLCVIATYVFAGEITVSAAASLKDAMGEIKKVYEEEYKGGKVILNFGGSGALQQQIENGAPVDIFISAAPKQMNELNKKGLIIKETEYDLLKNDVVLIVSKSSKVQANNFNDLTKEQIKTIGIGEPKSVPVGQYSIEIFNKLNIMKTIENKLIYGKDVKAVLAWVETGNVDAGIVYKTDAIISSKVKVAETAPKGSHSEVIYPVAIIKDTKDIQEAKRFLSYLKGKKSKEIFTKYGFTTF
jgi:molybdate transport system substrate-binding protein